MLGWIRKEITPPVFEDREKTHRARLLNNILWTVMLFILLGLPFYGRDLRLAAGGWVLVGAMLVLRSLAYRGRVYLASAMLVGLLEILFALNTLFFGGIHSPQLAFFFIAIITAGLLLQRVGTILATLGAALWAVVLYLLEAGGVVSFQVSLSQALWIYLVIFLMMGILIQLSVYGFQSLVRLLQQGEQETAMAYAELQAGKMQLEARAADRTEEVKAQRDLFASLVRVAEMISSEPDLAVTLKNIIQAAIQLTDAERANLIVLNDTGLAAWSLSWDNQRNDVQMPVELAQHVIDSGLAGWVLREKRSVLIPDVDLDERWAPGAVKIIRSALSTYLARGGMPVGVLTLSHQAPEHFSPQHLQVMNAAAGQIALTVYNAQLFEQQRLLAAELAEARDAAESAREAAEHASRSKSAFLANVSHELRTPLNAILGFAQLMGKDEALGERQRENLGTIHSSGQHLLALINNVLEMSKIEAGKVSLNLAEFDLIRLLDDLRAMFNLRAQEKSLRLTFDLMPGLPRYVYGDDGKIRQVLVNLLGNAIKFTETGEVRLTAWAEPASSNGEAVEIGQLALWFEVQDTGVGILPGDLAAIFDPFVQASWRRRGADGTGLGLAISREYAHLLGGDIVVESVAEPVQPEQAQPGLSHAGTGSSFRFWALVQPVAGELPPADEALDQVIGLQPGQPEYRILIVEDEPANARLLQALLAPLGFAVQIASDGALAVQTWQRWKPHLIWMDLRMPVMDGYEATQQIRAAAGDQEVKIIALTANAFEEDRERALQAGCDDFLRKPLQLRQIYAALEQHLALRFRYTDDSSQREAVRQLSPDELPAGWLEALRRASALGDFAGMQQLAQQIQEAHPAAAAQLRTWIEDFNHDEVAGWIQAIERSGEGGT